MFVVVLACRCTYATKGIGLMGSLKVKITILTVISTECWCRIYDHCFQ